MQGNFLMKKYEEILETLRCFCKSEEDYIRSAAAAINSPNEMYLKGRADVLKSLESLLRKDTSDHKKENP
jgi:hypothetical protein